MRLIAGVNNAISGENALRFGDRGTDDVGDGVGTFDRGNFNASDAFAAAENDEFGVVDSAAAVAEIDNDEAPGLVDGDDLSFGAAGKNGVFLAVDDVGELGGFGFSGEKFVSDDGFFAAQSFDLGGEFGDLRTLVRIDLDGASDWIGCGSGFKLFEFAGFGSKYSILARDLRR